MRNSDEKHPALDLLAHDERALSLSASRRGRILRQTFAARRAASPAAAGSGEFLSSRIPAASWAAVLAFALVLVGAGYIWHPGGGDPTPLAAPAGPPSGGVDLTVSQVADAVVLEWSDGSRRAYTVRQATSPKKVREAPGIEVTGNRFVDRSASDSPVVYYLVE